MAAADSVASPRQGVSSALPLALVWAGFIVYASLYPFAGWRGPMGPWAEWLTLPLPPWRDTFDQWANFAGYAPLGLLAVLAVLRSGGGLAAAVVVGAACAPVLSFAMEVAQHALPGRYPSLLDWRLNTAGGLAGAALAVALQAGRGVDAWQALRARWFVSHSGPPLALLLLWPVGLLFPAPLPLTTGPNAERLRLALFDMLGHLPRAVEWLDAWERAWPTPLSHGPWFRVAAIGLGLAVPLLLAASVMRATWRRAVVALAVVAAGLTATTLSSALNFGPQHALAWLLPAVGPGMAVALVLAALALPLPRRAVALLGLAATLGLLALAFQAAADPYFAQSLSAWEQGRFIRLHGLAQWVGWLWPLAALAWFVARLLRRAEPHGARHAAPAPGTGMPDHGDTDSAGQ